jgi:hypothetical protein
MREQERERERERERECFKFSQVLHKEDREKKYLLEF